MSEGVMTALGPCWSCKKVFLFDPEKVTSVSVCHECAHPSDMHTDDCTRSRPGAVYQEPLCLDCARLVNEARARRGEPPVRILPGAYPE